MGVEREVGAADGIGEPWVYIYLPLCLKILSNRGMFLACDLTSVVGTKLYELIIGQNEAFMDD